MEGLGVSAGPGPWGIPVFTAATSTHCPENFAPSGSAKALLRSTRCPNLSGLVRSFEKLVFKNTSLKNSPWLYSLGWAVRTVRRRQIQHWRGRHMTIFKNLSQS